MRKSSKDELLIEYEKVRKAASKKPRFFLVQRYLTPAFHIFIVLFCLTNVLVGCGEIIGIHFNTYQIRNSYSQFKTYLSSQVVIRMSRLGGRGAPRPLILGQRNNPNMAPTSLPQAATTTKLYTRDQVKLAIKFGYDSAGVKPTGVKIRTEEQKKRKIEFLTFKFFKTIVN